MTRRDRSLKRIQSSWDRFGAEDPLWAVLTDPAKRGGQWDLDEFLATGHRDVDLVFAELESLGVVPTLDRALDFGCGVGRLTQALAARFATVDGVDIAAAMIAEARRLDETGRCAFHLNRTDDLARFPDATFQLVLSLHVLQHMPPALAEVYLAEMARVLAPAGVLVLHLPTQRRGHLGGVRALAWNQAVRARHAVTGRPGMEMHVWAPDRVERLLEAHGLRIASQERDHGAEWEAARYVAVRSATA